MQYHERLWHGVCLLAKNGPVEERGASRTPVRQAGMQRRQPHPLLNSQLSFAVVLQSLTDANGSSHFASARSPAASNLGQVMRLCKGLTFAQASCEAFPQLHFLRSQDVDAKPVNPSMIWRSQEDVVDGFRGLRENLANELSLKFIMYEPPVLSARRLSI